MCHHLCVVCLCTPHTTHVKYKNMHRVHIVGKTSVFSQIPYLSIYPSLRGILAHIPAARNTNLWQGDSCPTLWQFQTPHPDWNARLSAWTQSCGTKGQVILPAEALFCEFLIQRGKKKDIFLLLFQDLFLHRLSVREVDKKSHIAYVWLRKKARERNWTIVKPKNTCISS